jgi:AraC-like DNA-binding protein
VVVPALAAYVAGLAAYDTDLGAPGVHRGLPSRHLTLVLPIGAPLDVGWVGDRDRAPRWSTVSGLHAAPAQIHHDGTQRGVFVALTPAGARALLGVPAGELRDTLLEGADVAPELADLPERLHDVPLDLAEAVVQDVLLRALARRGDASLPPAVAHALSALGRGTTVTAAAAEVGYSRRRLGTLVRRESGLTPKEYHRVARFERSRDLLGHRPLVEVAARCGYADQGHLGREWQALAGCTPTTWLREEFPFLRDPDASDETG